MLYLVNPECFSCDCFDLLTAYEIPNGMRGWRSLRESDPGKMLLYGVSSNWAPGIIPVEGPDTRDELTKNDMNPLKTY